MRWPRRCSNRATCSTIERRKSPMFEEKRHAPHRCVRTRRCRQCRHRGGRGRALFDPAARADECRLCVNPEPAASGVRVLPPQVQLTRLRRAPGQDQLLRVLAVAAWQLSESHMFLIVINSPRMVHAASARRDDIAFRSAPSSRGITMQIVPPPAPMASLFLCLGTAALRPSAWANEVPRITVRKPSLLEAGKEAFVDDLGDHGVR
jgi:hypothetical protein